MKNERQGRNDEREGDGNRPHGQPSPMYPKNGRGLVGPRVQRPILIHGNLLYGFYSVTNIAYLYIEVKQRGSVRYTHPMLYTGKGDSGTTTAFGCDQQKISKSSELPEALGALDELNAWLGFVKVRAAGEPRIASVLREQQEMLFIVQAEIAGADKRVSADAVKNIETLVNDIEKEIPPLKGFSISGGTELSALLDVARTLSRRAERRVIAACEARACTISDETRAYLNRLSSLLFALARLANRLAGVAEETPRY